MMSLVAMAASARDYYAISIGKVMLAKDFTTSEEALTKVLKDYKVIDSGSVNFTCDEDKGTATLTLTDVVLKGSRNEGMLQIGKAYGYENAVDFPILEIVLKGDNKITNTKSDGSALFIGGEKSTDAILVKFMGDGSLTLEGSSKNNGAGIATKYYERTILQMTTQVNVTTTGMYGVSSWDETEVIYRMYEGRFTATGTECAIYHTCKPIWAMRGTRVVDPEGMTIGQSGAYYTAMLGTERLKTFTVQGKKYPVYVCGIQVNGDNDTNLTTLLTEMGVLKSGSVWVGRYSGTDGLLSLYFNSTVIDYDGPAIVQNGVLDIPNGTNTPGINGFELEFVGENVWTNSNAGGCCIDNNKANLALDFKMDGILTLNSATGICHNYTVDAGTTPTDTYELKITGNDYKEGENDPARFTINASNTGIRAVNAGILYENSVTTINAKEGAILSIVADGITPFAFTDRTAHPELSYGFRNGETMKKDGNYYRLVDLDGNVVTTTEIGWIGNTYDFKVLGRNLTDYNLRHPEMLFPGVVMYDGEFVFDASTNTLTFNNMGTKTFEATRGNDVPLFLNNMSSELKIVAVSENTINYPGVVMTVNGPTSFKGDTKYDKLTLHSLEKSGLRFGMSGVLDVDGGVLNVEGAQQGVNGSYTSPGRVPRTYQFGVLNMNGGRLIAKGDTEESIYHLSALNLNKSSVISPQGAYWNASKHVMVDASGNAIVGQEVELGVVPYDITVADVEVNSGNCDDVLGDGTVSYDNNAHILTLNGVQVNDENVTQGITVSNMDSLYIILQGDNSFQLKRGEGYGGTYGIHATRVNVQILGEGSLKFSANYGCQLLQGAKLMVGYGPQVELDGLYYGIFGHNYLENYFKETVSVAKATLKVSSTNFNSMGLIDELNLTDCSIIEPAGAYFADGCVRLAWNNPVKSFVVAPAPLIQKGDVNADGNINGSDVTALYNVLLDNETAKGDADVNGDGNINGSDVTSLYNILLGD